MSDNNINGIIYKIVFPKGKHYIGLTTCNIKQRQREHKSAAKAGTTPYVLYKALRKYNMVDTFELIEIDTAETKEELCKKEIYYIQDYNSFIGKGNGYNMTLGGEGNLGGICTDETREKISKGRIQYNKNNPEKVKQSQQKSTETHRLPENRQKMSEKKTQYFRDNPEKARENKERMTMLFEDKNSSERRQKCSENIKTRFDDPEYKKTNAIRQTEVMRRLDSRKRGDKNPFVMYKKTGEYIGTFDYTCEAVEKLLELRLIEEQYKLKVPNKILRVLLQDIWTSATTSKRYFWHNLFFKYKSEMDDEWTFEKQINVINKKKETRYDRQFVVYNINTKKYIGEFSLMTHFCETHELEYNKYQGDFCAVLTNRQKTAHGYFLKYKDELYTDWTYDAYLEEQSNEKNKIQLEKFLGTIPKKLEKYKNVKSIDNDAEYYVKPYNIKKNHVGWYVYIDGIQTSFCHSTDLKTSKKCAIDFVNSIKLNISTNNIDITHHVF